MPSTLWGMAKAFEDQHRHAGHRGPVLRRAVGPARGQEVTERTNRQVRLRLKKAHLRMTASLEDLDYRSPRGVDKALILELRRLPLGRAAIKTFLITGPTGVGKSYMACALAH